jgi:hypothetical protein
VLAVAGLVVGVSGVAGCGIIGAVPKNAGQAASVNLSLTTVPIVRSITVSVSPGSARFGNCHGGTTKRDTQSTLDKLGFPNGHCFVGLNPGFYPITITNTGIASQIDVNGTSAVPANGGDRWSLCNRDGGGTSCTHDDGQLPGPDQYLVENFSPNGGQNPGISTMPACDTEFDGSGRCWAGEGVSQSEGMELIGPSSSTNMYNTRWTITITWTPVPGHG